MSCTYSRVTVFEDGKLRPNHITNFQTVDGKLRVAYFIERYKEIKVENEKMLWPSTFPPHENVWVDESDKEVKTTIRIINYEKIPYILVFNQVTTGDLDKVKVMRENVVYNGRLPYQEFVIDIRKVKGNTTVWFDIYHNEKIYCFTRDMKFKY
jgi:hypothetical protein